MTDLVTARVRVRPVDRGRIQQASVYMYLRYDPAEPYEVRIQDPGMGEIPFARDLLEAALRPDPLGEAPVTAGVSLHLALLGPEMTREMVLVLRTGAPHGIRTFAISPRAAAAFLDRTYELVPAGEEGHFLDLDASIARFLESAA